ncbi:cytochrome c-type biogenesis protein [Pseudoroseicyclus aestuarii]|uniref:Cytochrome c-type biogenesis protein n=1 Tax=Pseudoroseicyclus aestuarii TaxID=1795041 RepID=A0A318SSA9_9RHOB|nr:cytochrome c-type biogenesis protein [Pseudoroseicyclus aestuarii]PYE81256.1 cytochrome c-type biogenesis protein CcmH [Pseudoroseicyclus aestuarii]
MRRLALLLWLVLALPAWAVQPGEVLEDPALEARARAISTQLRCPVCRNENIDDSNAALARDLRLMVRERLVAGDSDAQVVDALVARYGEYVLLRPAASGANLVLWLAPLALFIAGAGLAVVVVRRRSAAPAPAGLTPEERAQLEKLLGEDRAPD